MASIRRTPSGKYQARIYLGKDENGRPKIKSITKDTMMACKRAAAEIERHREVF